MTALVDVASGVTEPWSGHTTEVGAQRMLSSLAKSAWRKQSSETRQRWQFQSLPMGEWSPWPTRAMALAATDCLVVDGDPLSDDMWWFEILPASAVSWSTQISDRHVDVFITRHPGACVRTRRLDQELAVPGRDRLPYDLSVGPNNTITYAPVMRDMIRVVVGTDRGRYIPSAVMKHMMSWLTINETGSTIIAAHDLRATLLQAPQVLDLNTHTPTCSHEPKPSSDPTISAQSVTVTKQDRDTVPVSELGEPSTGATGIRTKDAIGPPTDNGDSITVSSKRSAVCEWCGESFQAAPRGRLPRFCRRSHRQRAYEARASDRLLQGAPAPAPVRDVTAHGGVEPAFDEVLAALGVAVADSAVDSREAARPTVLLPKLESLLDAIADVLVDVRYDADDIDMQRRFVVAGGSVETLRTQRSVAANHPRSARRIGQAITDARHIADALLAPAAAGKAARHSSRPLRLAIGDPATLPSGVVDVAMNASGHREVFWYSNNELIGDCTPLHRAVGRRTMPHCFASRADWDEIAVDLVLLCTGWAHTALPAPSMLTTTAASRLSRQLQSQHWVGEWAISSTEVIDWLVDAGHVSIASQPEQHRFRRVSPGGS